jgi:hypothetical protein
MLNKYVSIRAKNIFSATVLICMAMFIIGLSVNLGVRAESKSVKLTFTSKGKDEYVFDTGVLRGKLRKDGRTLGLSSVSVTIGFSQLTSVMGMLRGNGPVC